MPAETEHGTHRSAVRILMQKMVYDYISDRKWLILKLCGAVLLTLPVETVVLPQFYSKLLGHIKEANVTAAKTVLVIILALWLLVLVFTGVKATLDSFMAPDYMAYIRKSIMSAIIERYTNEYQDIRVGEQITRILDLSRSLSDVMAWFIAEAFPIIVVVLCMIGYFFSVSPVYGSILLVGAVLSGVVLYYTSMRCVSLSAKRQVYFVTMSEKLTDSIGNLMNIYLNNADAEEVEKNRQLDMQYATLYKTQQLAGRNSVLALCFSSIFVFGALAVCMYRDWRSGRLAVSTFITAWIVLLYYMSANIRVCNQLLSFLLKLGCIDYSAEFIADTFQPNILNGQKRDVIQTGKVSFRNVIFQYPGTTSPILSGFNLEVAPEEKVALLGTSGSGKTTSMKLLVGMYPLTHADSAIYIDDTNMKEIDIAHIRDRVNYVNQRTQLFHTTILKNIQYGNNSLTEKQVTDTLQEYGLDSVYHKLKHGIHTDVGVHGGNLSLGMQKVTILLRGLFKPSKIVILDEPLAGLDSKTRVKIMKCIMDLCKNKTLIVITHDQEIIPFMNRVVNISSSHSRVKST